MRVSILPWCILTITILLLHSCTTLNDQPVEPEHADFSNNSDNTVQSHPSDPELFPKKQNITIDTIYDSEKAIDPFSDVAGLWYEGLAEEARARFMSADVKLLKESSRSDEWFFWRGRLFVQSWSGSALGLSGENVSALLSDGDDIWAGTWTGGLIRLSEPLGTHTVFDPGLPSLAVRTVNRITSNGDRIWIVRYGSLEHYDKRSGKWSVEQNLPVSERIQDISFFDGNMYLATLGHGLWVKKKRSWERIQYPGLFINRLETGSDGELLVSTMDRGLYIYKSDAAQWSQPPPGLLRETNVTSMMRFDNHIFGGTYGKGAYIWDTDSTEVKYFGAEQLGDPWVLAVSESGGRYFFGTFGAGLNSLDAESGTWDRIGLAEGIPSADIASLISDDNGNLWAGTLGGGIIRISSGIYGD